MANLAVAAHEAKILQRKQRGFWHDAGARLIRSTNGQVGIVIVIILVLTALLAITVFPYNPRTDSDLPNRLKSPTWAPQDAEEKPSSHFTLMGTDDQGRDVLQRVIHGAPISLQVGLVSVVFALAAGSAIGLIAGFFGGGLDNFLMRLMDIMLAFPSILLAIGIVAARGPGLNNTILAISIVNIPIYARITRSTTLSIKEQDYILAANMIGSQNYRLIFRHVLPNSLTPIIVQGSLSIATAILEAAGLGFLGLGAQPPTPEWGAMLADGYKYLTIGAWWVLFFPGAAIMLTVLGFNLLGDGLRDALDPRRQA
ncbi:MAG: ABC transporter permease [Chloroflexi bacterium]|nr:ABC transporter permease [Chloroflexota bacterium]